MRIIELIVVMAACVAPTFYLANTIDGDEFAKGSLAIAEASGAFMALKAYGMWRNDGTKPTE